KRYRDSLKFRSSGSGRLLCQSASRRRRRRHRREISDEDFRSLLYNEAIGERTWAINQLFCCEETWGLPAARKHFTGWIDFRLLFDRQRCRTADVSAGARQ